MRNRNGYVYTDDAKAFEAARELNHERAINRADDHSKNVISPERVLEKIRTHRGYKRTKVEDINRVVRYNNKYSGNVTYVVEFKRFVSKNAKLNLNLN